MANLMTANHAAVNGRETVIKPEGHDINSHQKIPSNLLLTLKQDTNKRTSEKTKEKKLHNIKLPPLAATTVQDSSPGNVWHHPKQRQKLKYLTDNTQCVCGAGRDISFIYDTTTNSVSQSDIPESLIPAEYHVVKHTGVVGLDLYDETYSAMTSSHDRHLTTFPSMRPSGRQEVLELKNTLDQMIGSIRLSDIVDSMELKGPTQVHNLIQLIKKEQEIYNICFHELIRQVTVHCTERGSLLSEIRQCYSLLLSKIPYQVKSLHDEVVAQRALDRKLTTELVRFHRILTNLTRDLCELRDQNEVAGEEVEETKENLLLALAESEKNATLLGEYSHLYELQRHRLEDQIAHLSKERELWERTCYQLATNVADHHDLQTVKQLQLSAKSWDKLAKHFAVILSEKNTTQLCSLQNDVHAWRRDLATFFQGLKATEEIIVSKLMGIYDDMKCWLPKLQLPRTSGTVIEKNEVEQFWHALLSWLKLLNELSDVFSGEKLINRIDELQLLKNGMSNWSEMALSILQRHFKVPSSTTESTDKPLDDIQNTQVTSLVNDIEEFFTSLSVRTTGENGIAINFVRLITPMESWDTTFKLVIHGGKFLSDSNYDKLLAQMDVWLGHVSATLECLSALKVQDDKERFDIMLSQVDKWCSSFCHGVQIDDNNVIQQITELYSSLIQWMAQILITLSHTTTTTTTTTTTATNENGEDGTNDSELLGDLQSNCTLLCDKLTAITNEIIKSCNIIFDDEESDDLLKGNDIISEERHQLQTLGNEYQNWIRLSTILIDSLPQNTTPTSNTDTSNTSTSNTDTGTDTGTRTGTRAGEEEGGTSVNINIKDVSSSIMTIGIDDNITPATESNEQSLMYDDDKGSDIDLDLHTEKDIPEGRGVQVEELEKLVIEMDELKSQISTLENKLVNEQQRADVAEKQVKEAQNNIDQLNIELKQAKNEIQDHNASKKGKKGTRVKSKESKT